MGFLWANPHLLWANAGVLWAQDEIDLKPGLDGQIYLQIYLQISDLMKTLSHSHASDLSSDLSQLFARAHGERMSVSCDEIIYLELAAVIATNENCRKRKRSKWSKDLYDLLFIRHKHSLLRCEVQRIQSKIIYR